MRLRTAGPAGLADAGFASLATFVAGLVAVRYLTPGTLGAYALFHRAFLLAAVVPAQLVLQPATIEALSNPRPDRVGVLSQSLRLAALPAVLAAAATSFVGLMAGASTRPGELLALSLTTSLATLLSPLQDHVRRVFHHAGMSWKAAAVSITQFGTTVSAVGAMLLLGVGAVWIPFGALAAANAVSLSLGLGMARFWRRVEIVGSYQARHLVRSGRWLLAGAIIPTGAAFVASTLVVGLAGAEALGFAEAARIVSQPLLVFALGLAAVFNPRAMELARTGQEARARRLSNVFDLTVVGSGLVLLLVIGIDWQLNPFVHLVPNAYEIGGLAAVTILANTVNATVKPQQAQLIATRRERRLAGAEFSANVVRVVVAGTAAVTKSFAVPLALMASGWVRIGLVRRWVAGLYTSEIPGTLPTDWRERLERD